jgi:hypothetical protein
MLPTAPTLTVPGSGARLRGVKVGLDWSAVSGATMYEVEVYDGHGTFSWLATMGGTECVVSATLPPGDIFWRVRGKMSCGVGPWSAERSFIVLNLDHRALLPMIWHGSP